MKEEDVKIEEKRLYCNGCLSSDRTLKPIGDLMSIFDRLCSTRFESLIEVSLCWECMTFIKKAQRFIKRAEIAEATLTCNYVQKKLATLSTLIIQSNINETYEIPIIYNEEKEKVVVVKLKEGSIQKTDKEDTNIKIETEDNEFNDNFSLINDWEENTYDSLTENNDLGIKFDTSEDLEDKSKIRLKIEKSKKDIQNELYKNDKPRWKSRYYGCYKILTSRWKRDAGFDETPIKYINVKSLLERDKETSIFVSSDFKCNSCVCIFDDQRQESMHKEKYHKLSSGKFVCDYCKSRFKQKQSLNHHIQRHSADRQCQLCQFLCHSPRLMKSHRQTHGKDSVMCLVCTETFPSNQEFYVHYDNSHRGPIVCKECGKKCKTKYLYQKHMNNHEAYRCKLCPKRYTRKYDLRMHMESQHNAKSKETAYCVQCDKQFSNTARYRDHLKSASAHASEEQNRRKKQFPCPECDNVYKRYTYMRNHYNYVHKQDNRYYCQECQKSFLNNFRYRNHIMYFHEKREKPRNHICTTCERGFNTKKILINHIRTHTGERPHACNLCSAKFAQVTALKTHVKNIHMKHNYQDKRKSESVEGAN